MGVAIINFSSMLHTKWHNVATLRLLGDQKDNFLHIGYDTLHFEFNYNKYYFGKQIIFGKYFYRWPLAKWYTWILIQVCCFWHLDKRSTTSFHAAKYKTTFIKESCRCK